MDYNSTSFEMYRLKHDYLRVANSSRLFRQYQLDLLILRIRHKLQKSVASLDLHAHTCLFYFNYNLI